MTTISCSISIREERVEALQNLALPVASTSADLQLVLDNLDENSDAQQHYDFYIDSTLITESVGDALASLQLSHEQNVQINAVPTSTMTVAALARCSADMAGHEDAVLCLQFSPLSTELVSGSGDKTVRIWDVNTATCKRVLSCFSSWVLVLRYSPDGRFLASADHQGALYLFQTSDYALIYLNKHYKARNNAWVTAIAWRPDSGGFFTGGKDGVVREYDCHGHEQRALCQLSRCVTDVTTGASHAIVSSEDCRVYVFDLCTRQCVHTIRHAHWANSVCTSLDYYVRFGCHAISRNFDVLRREIAKISPAIASKSAFDALPQQEYNAILAAFLASRPEYLVTSSDDHTMQLFALRPEFRAIATLTGHVKAVSHAIFSPDGMYIASSGYDRAVRLFDISGRFIYKFPSHVAEVYKLAFSADSRYLLSCSKDSTCKLYSIKKRKMIRDLPGHSDEVYCVDWSLDGEIGASAGKDKIVKLWRQ